MSRNRQRTGRRASLRREIRKTITCPSGKRVFFTRADAEKTMRIVNETNERKGDPRRLRGVYPCPKCVGFHTSKMSQEG